MGLAAAKALCLISGIGDGIGCLPQRLGCFLLFDLASSTAQSHQEPRDSGEHGDTGDNKCVKEFGILGHGFILRCVFERVKVRGWQSEPALNDVVHLPLPVRQDGAGAIQPC